MEVGDGGECWFGRLDEGADAFAWDEWVGSGRGGGWVGGGGGRVGFESSWDGVERVGEEGWET